MATKQKQKSKKQKAVEQKKASAENPHRLKRELLCVPGLHAMS